MVMDCTTSKVGRHRTDTLGIRRVGAGKRFGVISGSGYGTLVTMLTEVPLMVDSLGLSSSDEEQTIQHTIIEEVRRHYRDSNAPYYLSGLGEFCRSHGIEIPPGMKLNNFVKNQFGGDLLVVQDPEVPAKIAISIPEEKERVAQLLAQHTSAELDRADVDFSRLPFALVAAFCMATDTNTGVYFRTVRPFRYVTAEMAPDHTYIEIDAKFRPAHAETQSFLDLSEAQRTAIDQRIVEWAQDKNVDLRSFYYDRAPARPNQRTNSGTASKNALQRLVEAQEPRLQSQVLIPGDIAVALMKLP